MGKEITDTVERVFFRLSGLTELPAAPPMATNNPPLEENGELGEQPSSSSSSRRKRSFDDAELHESGDADADADALANGTGKRPAADSSEDSGAQISGNRCT